MIINIRGTSGTGKSTLARRVIESYSQRIPFREKPREGERQRRRPLGYLCIPEKVGAQKLFVPGHYDTPCGGCDTVPNYETVFRLIREAHDNGHHVLYEGLLLSGDVKWTGALHADGLPLQVVALDVPLDTCIERINARRRAKKPDAPPVKEENTRAKYKGTQLSMARLEKAGVQTFWYSPEDAYNHIMGVLQ